MQTLFKEAKANVTHTKSTDNEGTLNKMAMWLEAVSKCPPRHYGKIWNDEKESIVKQCQRMYIDAQRLSGYYPDRFMGERRNRRDLKNTDGDGRFMPLSRLRYNIASAKWDFTNQVTTGKNQYWDNDQAKKKQKVKIIKGNEKSWALHHLSVPLMSRDQDTAEAMEKIVQPYSEWVPRTGPVDGPTHFSFSELKNQPQHGKAVGWKNAGN